MKPLPTLLRALPVWLGVALSACSTTHVRSNFDPFTDFGAYQTYSWLSGTAPDDAAFADEIHGTVETALDAKGLKSAAADAADLRVRSMLHLEQKQQINDPYYAFSASETYEEGTLVLELIDAKDDRLVWRGTGSTRLREHDTPERRKQLIDEAVQAILAEYPPEAP